MKVNVVRLAAVIDRDLKKFKRNPVVIAMSVLMPILYLFILGNSFQGKLHSLPLAIVDNDRGSYSKILVQNLRAIEAGPKTLDILNVLSENEVLIGVREDRYKAGLIIPQYFSKNISLNARPELGLILDNTDTVSSGTIAAAVTSAVASVNSQYTPIRENPQEIYLREINLFKKIDYYQSLVPGIVIMAIFLGTLTTGAFNLVMDKFLGVEESYLLTPITGMEIVAGLIISGVLITTIIATFILVVGVVMTGISFPRNIGVLVSIIVIVVLTTLGLLSLMFVILGRFDHPRIVGILSGFMNVILFFPSGAIYPIASFPNWLKAFAMINPEVYAVHALKGLLFKGATISTVFGDILFLAIFTVVMMTIAVMTFKRAL
ncbi:MAG: ABC transporter permease [bacterium]